MGTDTSHQSSCGPRGVRGRGGRPIETCRISVLGAVIFLSTATLMAEPQGLITPPLLRLVVQHRCQSEGCLLHDWCSCPHKGPPSTLLPHQLPSRLASVAPGSAPFILKWRRPATHQPGPSACSLLHCLASEKDYYFNSIYCE